MRVLWVGSEASMPVALRGVVGRDAALAFAGDQASAVAIHGMTRCDLAMAPMSLRAATRAGVTGLCHALRASSPVACVALVPALDARLGAALANAGFDDAFEWRAGDSALLARWRLLQRRLGPREAVRSSVAGSASLSSGGERSTPVAPAAAPRGSVDHLSKLLAGIAHEINTPVQFVGNNLRFIADGYFQLRRLRFAYRAQLLELAPGALESLRLLEQEVEASYLEEELPTALYQSIEGMDRVIVIMQALNSIARAHDETERRAIDLNQAIWYTLIAARNEIKHVADVDTDFCALPLVPCRPGELGRVLLDMLLAATRAAGDETRDSEERGLVFVRTRCDGRNVTVAIGSGPVRRGQTDRDLGSETASELGAHNRAIIRERRGGALWREPADDPRGTLFLRIPLENPDEQAA